jgi:hypothetical protein
MNLSIQSELFAKTTNPWKRFLPRVEELSGVDVPMAVWDIPYTIPQLSYATHGHFRYYGKFPSSVAAMILEDYPAPHEDCCVVDNFCGSGTTLVEAKIRGIKSLGVDVSWLAAFASNVKTTAINPSEVLELFAAVKEAVARQKIDDEGILSEKFVAKWFTAEAARGLLKLQRTLLLLPSGNARDFLVLAYLAIIRRVSKAYDGEVRPHINKNKKPRDVWAAYEKKVRDMIANHIEFQAAIEGNAFAKCYVHNNLNLKSIELPGTPYLVVSHPPYLNSFDYRPVFSLEYFWGEPFRIDAKTTSQKGIEFDEIRSYPASETISEQYYDHLHRTYAETFALQQSGGLLAVVIGDCTVNKKLEPVLQKTADICERIGYTLEKVNLRTTHYGLGKYAYNFRADYHGDAEKRDGILILRKP